MPYPTPGGKETVVGTNLPPENSATGISPSGARSGNPMRQTHSSGTGSTAGPITLDSVRVVRALSPGEIAADRRKRQLLLFGAAAGLVVVALGLMLALKSMLGAREQSVAAATTSSAAAASASAPAPSGLVKIVVTAEAEVSEIRGPGVAEVKFTATGAELELPRSDQPVTLVVKLADGTELEESIIPSSNTALRVRSAKGGVISPKDLPTASSPTKPPPGQPVKGGGKKSGGLEANPYE